MSNLKTVPPPRPRNDEIGQLAGDVYKMYQALQVTIGQLETEFAREKEMEENQRYFFAAASHELKTPIAAASALLEGMLEIVSLSNDKITIEHERVNLNAWVLYMILLLMVLIQ
jgi:two-component system sensor histidine kinase VanS